MERISNDPLSQNVKGGCELLVSDLSIDADDGVHK